MTGNNYDNDRTSHIPDDDLVLFALQLLPEERMTQTMSHLQACAECRTEIAKVQGDLAAYSIAAEPETPPPSSRERFMRQLAREPRIAELPPFHLKPTEYDLRQPEKPAPSPPQSESLMGTAEDRVQHRVSDRVQDRSYDRRQDQDRVQDRSYDRRQDQDRVQDRPHDRVQDQLQDRVQERIQDRPQDRVPERSKDRTGDRAAEDRFNDLTLTGPKSSEPVFSARQSRILTRGTRRTDDAEVEVYREERRRPRLAPWVLAWTGWAVAAGCSFVAGLQLHQRQQMHVVMTAQQAQIEDGQRQAARAQQAQEALSTLTAATAMQVALHATPAAKPAIATKGAPPAIAPEALAAYLADKGALVFVATHMAPAPAGKTYELWLLPANGQSPIPAGTFKPDAQGSASVVLPELPKGVEAKGFGVTVENDGGSSTPTLPIVMS
jgi:anti-sigma-K factor RskA